MDRERSQCPRRARALESIMFDLHNTRVLGVAAPSGAAAGHVTTNSSSSGLRAGIRRDE